MANLVDYIMDLFKDPGKAESFVDNPQAALASIGLGNVTPEQLQAVAAMAAPPASFADSGTCVVPFRDRTVSTAERVSDTGRCSTTTSRVPLALPACAVTVAVPLPRAVTTPAPLTVRTFALAVSHVMGTFAIG